VVSRDYAYLILGLMHIGWFINLSSLVFRFALVLVLLHLLYCGFDSGGVQVVSNDY
jgi:hypothetical protein